MLILGIGGVADNAAAAIARDGVLLAAVEEEKLSRTHRPGELPSAAIASCLAMAKARGEDVGCVAVVRPVPSDSAFQLNLRSRFPNARVIAVGHHAAHAASAYFASPFDDATVLTLDRAGDFRCGARYRASGNTLTLDAESGYPDSLGDIYGRVTALLGFEPRADEHKVQWLSASGDDRFTATFLDILGSRDDGWPRVDRSYLDLGGFSPKLFEALGLDGAAVPAELRPHIAAGVQRAVERTVLAMAGRGKHLALAGGLFYNAFLIAALERSGHWERVFAQPAAGNAGASLGAVFHAWHVVMGETARMTLGNLCLGPSFESEEVKQTLENCKLRVRYLQTTTELIDTAVGLLAERQIVAWMHGRMEFGPRALGNRSILASPLDPYAAQNLNQYIKHRESFRKFAASVPAEVASDYFETGENARFLATASRVREGWRETFASALLGADAIRVHTVEERDNPLYWKLLHAQGKSTGLPVLYNTSFNLFGDPLVCTPRDAVRSFYSAGIDALFAGSFLVQK